jgi:hypothetical protein
MDIEYYSYGYGYNRKVIVPEGYYVLHDEVSNDLTDEDDNRVIVTD